MFVRFNTLLTLIVGIVLASQGLTAHASVFLGDILILGADNLLEDQNREAFVDRSPGSDAPDGQFGVGDVLVGFARIDDHTAPAGAFGDLGNRVYGIFSQEVVDINATGNTHEVIFDATTVAGLTLSDLTGLALPSEGILAMFDSVAPFPLNLINQSPGDENVSGTTNLWDYFAEIVNNAGPAPQPSFVAGIGNAGGAVLTTPGPAPIAGGPAAFAPLPDHFIARTTPTGSTLISGGVGGIATLGLGSTIANFEAGLSILLNNDASIPGYARKVGATETGGGFFGIFHDLSITGGTVKGALGAVNASQWTNINPDSSLSNPGGFTTDADIIVHPIPEPSSLLTMGGLFLLALAFARARRTKGA